MRYDELIDICELAYSSPNIVSGIDAAVYVPHGRTMIVAVRGTTTGVNRQAFRDWDNDFHALLYKHPDFPGRVHHGFLSSYLALNQLLPQWSGDWFFTGHSKGASVAALFAHALRCRAVTFAGAKFGDKALSAGYAGKLTCFVNQRDVVPTLPLIGYARIGEWREGPSVYGKLDWERNHNLETGYRPWVPKEEVGI